MKRSLLLAGVGLSCAMTLLVVAQTKPPLPARTPSPFIAAHASTQLTTQTVPSCVPQEDRVGFPSGFRENYTLLYTLDREASKQVMFLYGNDQAASTQPGEPFPYGSILVFDPHRAVLDEQGDPVLDENGRFIAGENFPRGIGVMRKEKGFGEDYCEAQAGEWEWVAYNEEDGSYVTPPQDSWTCASCHQFAKAAQLSGAVTDYVFRMNLFFAKANGAVPSAVMQNVKFLPRTLEVPAGTTVTWYNDDRERHRIVADDDSFASPDDIQPGTTFSQKFTTPGEYSYHCSVHAGMKHGKVIVK